MKRLRSTWLTEQWKASSPIHLDQLTPLSASAKRADLRLSSRPRTRPERGPKATLHPGVDIPANDYRIPIHSLCRACTFKQGKSCSTITKKLCITCEISDSRACQGKESIARVMLTPLVLTFAYISPQEENFSC